MSRDFATSEGWVCRGETRRNIPDIPLETFAALVFVFTRLRVAISARHRTDFTRAARISGASG